MLTSFINENKNRYFFLSLICCTLFIIIQWALLPASYTSDTADGVWHYLIARYSYWNPSFELDLWAKPVFTILAAPFAQFGLKGIHLMQIICAFLTSIMLFKISNFFNIKHLWLIPILLIFTPVYFPELFSGLTEIVFAFFLVWGIYMVVINEWLFATILFSFLPFVRQEGYFIFPLIGLLLLLQKKYFYIPLLFMGYILITLYGYSTHHSLMWIANNNPYKGAQDIYEKGDFLFYINSLDELLGTSRKVLFYIGSIISLYTLVNGIFTFKKNNIPANKLFHLNFLTLGFIVLFITAESIFWKFGLFGAMDMHRLITCVVPLMVLIIIFGLDMIYTFALTYNLHKVYIIALTLLTVFFINVLFKTHYWPMELKGESIVVADACEWLKKSKPIRNKVIYSHPYTIIALSLNPYNNEECAELFIIKDKLLPEKNVNLGELIVWDAHFSPNECRIPLSSLLNNPNFKLLKKFSPKNAFKVLGDHTFEVLIFERI